MNLQIYKEEPGAPEAQSTSNLRNEMLSFWDAFCERLFVFCEMYVF